MQTDTMKSKMQELMQNFKGSDNCLKRSIAYLEVFKGLDFACKYPGKHRIADFTFSDATRKELFQSMNCWTITKQQDLVNLQVLSKSHAKWL